MSLASDWRMQHLLLMHLIILAHPDPHSLSDSLARSYGDGLAESGAEISYLALRDLQFDLQLRAGYKRVQELEPDLKHACSQIERAVHVSWFFPTWWGGPPALLKGFVDRTFLPGWAFAYKKGSALPATLLAGRSARVVTTMDSPNFWYWLWHRSSVHTAFVNATLRFVGFGPVHSTTLFSQKSRTAAQRAAWLGKLRQLGRKDGQVKQDKVLGSGGSTAVGRSG